MIVGFTGTRHGMTAMQSAALAVILNDLAPEEFHHGDCHGADAEAHDIVRQHLPACHIHVHPGPEDDSWRAGRTGDTMHPAKTHFARNRDIVDAADVVIGAPQEAERQPRGGTWYTLGYARKNQKRVIIICPDGSVQDSEE